MSMAEEILSRDKGYTSARMKLLSDTPILLTKYFCSAKDIALPCNCCICCCWWCFVLFFSLSKICIRIPQIIFMSFSHMRSQIQFLCDSIFYPQILATRSSQGTLGAVILLTCSVFLITEANFLSSDSFNIESLSGQKVLDQYVNKHLGLMSTPSQDRTSRIPCCFKDFQSLQSCLQAAEG